MQQQRPYWEIMVPMPWGGSINLMVVIALAAVLLVGIAMLTVLIVISLSRRKGEH